jgi:hypothetical protein
VVGETHDHVVSEMCGCFHRMGTCAKDDCAMTLSRARMPSAVIHTSRRVHPLGFYGTVALVVAAECFSSPRAHNTEPSPRVQLSWNTSITAADGPEARAEVLCLGDSLIKLGILPRVLEDRVGARAYNLAVLGGQAPSSYFLLRRVLEKGIRPQGLLVDFSEDLLSAAPARNPTCWADAVGSGQSLELAWHSHDPALAISAGLHWLLPRWCDQNHKQPILGRAFESSAADDPRVFDRNWRFNRGAQVAPRAFVPAKSVQWENGQSWQPHPANAFYVDQLLRMAQAGKIPVFWILTPVTFGRREWLVQSGVHAIYRQFIAERLHAYACLTVLDGQRLFDDELAFRDPIHVNRDGAVRLTLAVAAAIKPRLIGEVSAPRWVDLVDLAASRINKYEYMIEDLDQSRAAVLALGAGQSSGEVALW